MKSDWEGLQERADGWANFRVGKVNTRIYFAEFADYWKVVGIIDQEVKRRIGKTINSIREAADRLEDEV